jgi:glycosyltransferase involved in cell wall biosynthesis
MKDDHKNISGIIRCIKKLRQIRNDFVFTFAGDASEQQRLEVKSGAVADCVEFTGEIEHNKVAALMQQSDVFVLFSNVENLPCVIIEALACGLPVISTNVGGISEVVNEQNGILIERGDEEALFKSMDYMLDHFDEYDPQRLHEYAAEKFSIKVIASKFLKIYQEALTNTRK